LLWPSVFRLQCCRSQLGLYIEKEQTEKLIDLSALAEKWPSAIVERQRLKEFSGGALNARTMANLDSKGQGIKGRWWVKAVDQALSEKRPF
jgi:hypothetical protein